MTLPLGFAENSIQLVPDGTLLLHILIILVMVYVLNATLFKPINQILAKHSGQPVDRIEKDVERDYIMNPEQAKDYGMIDEIIFKHR